MNARLLIPLVFLTITSGVETSAAQVTGPALRQALDALGEGGHRVLSQWSGSVPRFTATTTSAEEARTNGWIPITEFIAVTAISEAQLPSVLEGSAHDALRLSPRRFPLLDWAGPTIGLSTGREETGLTGSGTIIGVVDTGADVSHRALRNDDGSSRVRWLLAFGREPRGVHPELEGEYGCTGDDPCAVYSAADLDAILAGPILASLPKDPIGHGTHITSIAAGNDDAYPGVAPGADLIIVAAADPDGGVSDARILLGAKFVFERALESSQPAVVNISLGSSFGAHDGTSALEMGLEQLAEGPGRAIVLAAGNSGQLFPGDGRFPAPWGVHTKVAVVPGATVRVPLITPDSARRNLDGSLFVWISTNPSDDLSVGFDNREGAETKLIAPGSTGVLSSSALDDPDDYDVLITNGIDGGLNSEVGPTSSVVAIVGSWKAGRAFEIVLEGNASASLWVTGHGAVGIPASQVGPLFPRAIERGTVAVPGSSPGLITVGSSKNHHEWEDFTGTRIGIEPDFGTRSDFSAAGPNHLGNLKPELVAPGGGIIAAMAREADPRTSLDFVSQFRGSGICPTSVECFVIDDEHALASGTSMAAPLAAGTVALLMEREPALTMEQARRYLLAGTHRTEEWPLGSLVGSGELDVVGTLLAQESEAANGAADPSATHSRIAWASNFLHPDVALLGHLVLRDAENRSTSFESDAVEVSVSGPASVTTEEQTTGLVLLRVSAQEEAIGGSVTITTRLSGETLESVTFRIERDPTLARLGWELSGGTCTMSARAVPVPSGLLAFWVLLGLRVVVTRARGQRRLPEPR